MLLPQIAHLVQIFSDGTLFGYPCQWIDTIGIEHHFCQSGTEKLI